MFQLLDALLILLRTTAGGRGAPIGIQSTHLSGLVDHCEGHDIHKRIIRAVICKFWHWSCLHLFINWPLASASIHGRQVIRSIGAATGLRGFIHCSLDRICPLRQCGTHCPSYVVQECGFGFRSVQSLGNFQAMTASVSDETRN